MNWIRLLFIQIQTEPLSKHQSGKKFFDIECKPTSEKSEGSDSWRKILLS